MRTLLSKLLTQPIGLQSSNGVASGVSAGVPACTTSELFKSGFASLAMPEEKASPSPAMPPFNYTPKPYTGPSAEEVLNLRKTYLSPGRTRLRKPLLESTSPHPLSHLFALEPFTRSNHSPLQKACYDRGGQDAVLVRREGTTISGCKCMSEQVGLPCL